MRLILLAFYIFFVSKSSSGQEKFVYKAGKQDSIIVIIKDSSSKEGIKKHYTFIKNNEPLYTEILGKKNKYDAVFAYAPENIFLIDRGVYVTPLCFVKFWFEEKRTQQPWNTYDLRIPDASKDELFYPLTLIKVGLEKIKIKDSIKYYTFKITHSGVDLYEYYTYDENLMLYEIKEIVYGVEYSEKTYTLQPR
jgi:hypothetical protein